MAWHALQTSAISSSCTEVEPLCLARYVPARASAKRRRPGLSVSSPAPFPSHTHPQVLAAHLFQLSYPPSLHQTSRSSHQTSSSHVNRTIRHSGEVSYFSIISEKANPILVFRRQTVTPFLCTRVTKGSNTQPASNASPSLPWPFLQVPNRKAQ